LVAGGSGASVTVKGGESAGSSSSGATSAKTFAELTEDEKRRFLEIQKKDEEESRSQWGDGTYEKKIRYQKTESTAVAGAGVNVNAGGASSEWSGGVAVRAGEASGTTAHVNRGPTFTVGSSETGGAAVVRNEYQSRGTSSSDASSSSVHAGSSGGVTSSAAGGAGRVTTGSSAVHGVYDGSYGAAHFGETESASGSSSFHAESSGGGAASRFGAGQSSSSSSSGGSSNVAGHYGGSSNVAGGAAWSSSAGGRTASSEVRTSHEERRPYESRDGLASFHETENSHVVNTTWDDGGPPKTYVRSQWRTNDNGHVRNGSSSRVEDGLLDYREAIVGKMNAGGATNVVSNIPGDDSDLSVSATAAERNGHGFRQAKVDETETVQRWRTVDGKLYRVKNADDWDALIAKGGSTEVYEGQEYEPQNYARPTSAGDDVRRGQGQVDDGKFKLYTRFKRDTETEKCGPTRCATVKCKIGPLSKDQEVWLSFRSRAWVSTLKKVNAARGFSIFFFFSFCDARFRF